MPKETYNYESKVKSRRAQKAFIQANLRKRREDARVVCFPSAEAGEILEVFDPLGIPRKNIVGIERDRASAAQLRSFNLGIEIFEGEALDFFRETDSQFDIISLDYDGQFGKSQRETINAIARRRRLATPGILETNFYAKRESGHLRSQYTLDFVFTDTLSDVVDALRKSDKAEFREVPVHHNLQEVKQDPERLEAAKDKGITHGIIQIMNSVRDLEALLKMYRKFYPFYQNASREVREVLAARNRESLAGVDRSTDEGKVVAGFLEELLALYEKGSDLDLLRFGDVDFSTSLQSNFDRYLDRVGVGAASTVYLSSFFLDDYFPVKLERFRYTSDRGALMFMDLFAFDSSQARLKKYHHLFRPVVRGSRLQIEYTGHLCSSPKRKRNKKLVKADLARRQDISFVCNSFARTRPTGLKERVDLGSSFRPRLKATRERVVQALNEGLSEAAIIERFRGLTMRRLGAYKAHIKRGTYDPEQPSDVMETPADLSTMQVTRKSIGKDSSGVSIMPRNARRKLNGDISVRVRYFLDEIAQFCDRDQLRTFTSEIEKSGWYVGVESVPKSAVYAFFDDLTLCARAQALPGRKTIASIFDCVRKGGMFGYVSGLEIKPRITRAEAIYRLSSGESVEDLNSNFVGLSGRQLIACKGALTRKRNRLRSGLGGSDFVRMLDEGVSKEELIKKHGLTDYQIRGFKAAAKRGAYND